MAKDDSTPRKTRRHGPTAILKAAKAAGCPYVKFPCGTIVTIDPALAPIVNGVMNGAGRGLAAARMASQ